MKLSTDEREHAILVGYVHLAYHVINETRCPFCKGIRGYGC